jgi:hypothetical protein
VNRSFPFSLAAVRTRSSPRDTLTRRGVRRVLACPVFSSVPSLRSELLRAASGSGQRRLTHRNPDLRVTSIDERGAPRAVVRDARH